jgi:4-hydroxy-4-methyl-2-oxoglutarate aldolase
VAALSSALVASAGGDRVAVILGFDAAWPEASASGPALTVRGAPDDNLALHRAIDAVRPGELIVLDAGGPHGTAICGDLLARAARRRGAAGLVLDGPARDLAEIARLGFPVFHRGTSPATPRKEAPGELRVPVVIGDVGISPGDLVVADADGIVVVAAADADEVLARADELATREDDLRERIDAGESTLDLLGLRERVP